MADLIYTLEGIQQKASHLLSLCDALKEENELLTKENERLTHIAESQLLNTKELEEKLRIIKMAKSFSDTNEKTLDIKEKINEFVREIDKCITLLNR